MAETKDWRGNGRALGWFFAVVVLAVAIWAVVELLADGDEGPIMDSDPVGTPVDPARTTAPPAPPVPLRIS